MYSVPCKELIGFVHKTKVAVVKLSTIGVPVIPMFFANGIFFCWRSRVWEVLINDDDENVVVV